MVLRRFGKRLRNQVVIEEDDACGKRGRILGIQEHAFETPTNYVAATALQCNVDSQSLARVPPTSVMSSGSLPHIGRQSHWAWMETPVPDACPAGWDLFRVGVSPEQPSATEVDIAKLLPEVAAELDELFLDTHNNGFYINSYTTKVNASSKDVLCAAQDLARRHAAELQKKKR